LWGEVAARNPNERWMCVGGGGGGRDKVNVIAVLSELVYPKAFIGRHIPLVIEDAWKGYI